MSEDDTYIKEVVEDICHIIPESYKDISTYIEEYGEVSPETLEAFEQHQEYHFMINDKTKDEILIDIIMFIHNSALALRHLCANKICIDYDYMSGKLAIARKDNSKPINERIMKLTYFVKDHIIDMRRICASIFCSKDRYFMDVYEGLIKWFIFAFSDYLTNDYEKYNTWLNSSDPHIRLLTHMRRDDSPKLFEYAFTK